MSKIKNVLFSKYECSGIELLLIAGGTLFNMYACWAYDRDNKRLMSELDTKNSEVTDLKISNDSYRSMNDQLITMVNQKWDSQKNKD